MIGRRVHAAGAGTPGGRETWQDQIQTPTRAAFGFKIPNSNFFSRHLHGDLNLDEIKNALQLLSVNSETNLMNLIRL